MEKCEDLIQRFTLLGQHRSIEEISEPVAEDYELIFNSLITKLVETGGKVPECPDFQVINQIYTCNNECVTPLGTINVSMELLAKLLAFSKTEGIDWLVNVKQCKHTRFKKLSYFKIIVDCSKEKFISTAKEVGFRYPTLH